MLKRAASLVSVGCVVALVACVGDASDDGERSAAPDTDQVAMAASTSGQAGVVSNEDAIKGLVSARCAREAHCKNVGPDKEYADKAACEKKIAADLREDLSPKDCPRGIVEKELNDCLQSIQKEECDNPLKKLARVVECRPAQLCLPAE